MSSAFDIDSYLRNRADTESKLTQLAEASREKIKELTAYRDAAVPAPDKSWSTQLGLSPGGFTSNRVNDVASIVAGTSRLAGQVTSLPFGTAALAAGGPLSAEDYEASNRALLGTALPGDAPRLNRQPEAGLPTVQERLAFSEKQRSNSKSVVDFFNLESIVQPGNRKALAADIASGFQPAWDKTKAGWESGKPGDVVSGLADLLMGAGSAIASNPSGVREYVLENAPQLFVGALGKAGMAAMSASNIGYAVDNYSQGIQAYQARNGGALPPDELRQQMVWQSAQLALAEQAGDVVGLGLTKVAAKAATDAARTGFMRSLKNASAAALKGALTEAPTEGYQTHLEGEIAGKPASALDVYTGAVIGAASGGVLSGGGRLAAEVLGATPEHAAVRQAAQTKDQAQVAAIASGDVSTLLDPKSAVYNPSRAIAALAGNSALPTATPDIQQANLAKAGEIVAALEAERLALQDTYDSESPEGLQKNAAQLAGLKAQLAAADPADTAKVTQLQDYVAMAEEQVATTPKPDPKRISRLQTQMDTMDREIKRSQESLALFNQERDTTDVDVDAQVAIINTPVEESDVAAKSARSAAAATVLNLSMKIPERVSTKVASALEADLSNGLTAPQRAYLRAFTEARVAQNQSLAMGDVAYRIYTGKGRDIGIVQHRKLVTAALAAGNKGLADQYLATLRNFTEDHSAKADVAAEALAQHQTTGEDVEFLSDGKRGWSISTGEHLNAAARTKNGGWLVHKGTPPKDIAAMKAEASALVTATAELDAAYAMKFAAPVPAAEKTVVSQGATNVQVVPQAHIQAPSQPATEKAVPAPGVVAEPAPSPAGIPPTGSVVVPAAASVEPAGVDLPKGTKFDEITDPKMVLNLYRGEGPGNLADGGWWSFDRAEAQKYADANNGTVRTISMTAVEIASQTAQGHLGGMHRVFPSKTDIGVAPRVPAVEQVSIPDVVKAMSDTDLNAALEVEMSKPGYQKNRRFKHLDAEMTLRETVASSVKPVDSTAGVSDAVVTGDSTQPTSKERSEGQDQSKNNDSSKKVVDSAEGSAPPKSGDQTSEKQVRGLTVLREYVPEVHPEGTRLGSTYRTMKRAGAFLTQRQSKVEKDSDIKASQPLVDIQDMLTQWNEDKDLPSTFFPGVELDSAQALALTTFQTFANKWAPSIRAHLKPGSLPNSKGNTKNADQLFRDSAQDFFNADGTLDENIVTAIAYAAYSWLVDSTRNPALKKEEGVLAMHGLGEESEITKDGLAALFRMSAIEDSVHNSIGGIFISVLGFEAKTEAPQDYLSKVATAFGVHGLQLLLREGLVELHTEAANVLQRYMPDLSAPVQGHHKDGTPIYTYTSYIKIVRDDATLKTVGDGKTITESVTGSFGVLDKMFDSQHTSKEAELSPIPFKQEFAKRTGETVPETQRSILEEAHKNENRIAPDMYGALQVLGGSTILTAAGHKDLESGKIQANNMAAVRAQNNNLENQLDGMVGLYDPTDPDKPFYALQEVWRNFRVGIATWNMNLQSSKIHRFMFFRPEWKSTIRLDDEAKVNTFLLVVAQALGVKVDEQPDAETLEILAKRLKSESDRTVELSKLLIKAIKDPKGSALTPAQKEDIGELAAGAEGMQTLQALVAYGRYLEALESTDPTVDSFTVILLGGVDGKTNGPILSHLAMGAAASSKALLEVMARGGMYSLASGVKNFNHWYTQANSRDLYQDLAHAIFSTLPPHKQQQLKAIEVITKGLFDRTKVTPAGRKIVKVPLTSFAFGSSVQTSLKNMQGAFVQAVFDRIEDLAKGTDKRLTREALIGSINEMLRSGGAKSAEMFHADTTVEQLVAWKIPPSQDKALTQAFKQVLGPQVEKTMEKYFKVFIERRDAVNKAIQTSFNIYKAVYDDLREKEVARLMDSGDIDFTEVSQTGKDGKIDKTLPKIRKPIYDLTVGQESALRKKLVLLLPRAHSAYTQGTDDLGSGLLMAKKENRIGSTTLHQVEVQMGVPVDRPGNAQAIAINAQSMQQEDVDPGVAGLPYLMHSLDSFIMQLAIEGTESLNVHDEAANAADKIQDTARRLNESTWNAMLRFSPITESFEMLERAVVNVTKLVEKGDVSKNVLESLGDGFQDMLTEEQKKQERPIGNAVVKVALTNFKQHQYQAERIRLETMSQLGAVNQYTWEGGQYDVTDSDRAEAVALLEKLDKQGGVLSPETFKAAAALGKAISPAEEVTTEKGNEVKTSPFGELGEPPITSDPELVKFFETNPNPSVKGVLRLLYKVVKAKGDSQVNAFQLQLLQQLNKSIDPTIKVRLITAQTAKEDVLEMPKLDSLGWFVSKNGKSEIYVLSSDFKNSGLQTTETLLHELHHGALAHIVEREISKRDGAKDPETGKRVGGDPKYTGQVLDLVNDLDALRKKAATYAKEKGITEFDAALSDIQEFIAWGMTSQGFQRSIISQVTMQSKTGKNTLIDGMKEFITKLVGILFAGSNKSKQAQTVNGMTVLVKNVSGLLSEAEQEKEISAPSKLNHSMAVPGPDPMAAVQNYSTLDIHAALNAGDVTPEFDTHLRDILSGIVQKLHGPFDTFKATLMGQQAITPLDVWLKALDTGVVPFAKASQASPLKVSEQEAFAMDQVEATVRASLEDSEVTSRATYKELTRLYDEAKDTIKPSDFATQEEYDFIFKIDLDSFGKSHHLARFAAFGLAHQQFNGMLKMATAARRVRGNKSFAERLQRVFEDILEFFDEKVSRTFGGQQADAKLKMLVGQLVDIEAKKRLTLVRREAERSPLVAVENAMKSAGENLRAGVAKAAGSDFVRNNKLAFVQATGALARTYANDQVEWLMKTVEEFRDAQSKEKHGLAMGLLTDIRGPGKVLNALILATGNSQRRRKDLISSTSKIAMKSFAKNGKGLSKVAKAAISQVFLRTGMHALVGTGRMNMAGLENLMNDRSAMDAAITALEGQLSGKFKDHFLHQANALGYSKVTGIARVEALMLNAHNIARMYASPAYTKQVNEAQAKQDEIVIEQLVALYALRYVDPATLTQAKDLMRSERERTDKKGNGVESVLALHKWLEQESKARLFDGQGALMAHGHTPEIYNGHTDVKTANDADGKELVSQGYTKLGPVALDQADPDKETKFLYVLKDGGLAPRITGAFSWTGKNAKGKKAHGDYMNVNTADGLVNAVKHADIMNAKSWRLASGPVPDLSKSNASFMVPVVNPKGEIVNWRYMMKDATKDSTAVLERDSSFEKLLGVLAGSIYDKESTTELNTKVIEALQEKYVADRHVKPEGYVLVGPHSTDKDARETWSLLPDETKAVVRRIWGSDGMFVRKGEMTVVFGYRKQSLAEAVKATQARRKENAERVARGQTAIEDEWADSMAKIFTGVVEHVLAASYRVRYPNKSWDDAEEYAKRAAVVVARSERVWQELVHETKDILVVKTGLVTLGNIWSNLWLLKLNGVPLTDIAKWHLVALRGARAYTKDSADLSELQAQIDTGLTRGQDAAIYAKIARLKDAMSRNPVTKLIDDGLMPTIVEDMEEEDPYSYKSALAKKVEGFTKKLNPTVVSVAKTIYMTHDTRAYKGLARITQLSDFVARYTLYQHVTTRKEDRLNHEDAIFEASESFVNYSLPMHKSMQYMDDMGITMFSKYFLRIQRVLLKLGREHPAQVLTAVGLDYFLELGPIVLEGSAITRIGNNPFGVGAVNLPGSLGELATVNSAISLIKYATPAAQ